MPDKIRAFIAISLTPEAKSALRRVQEKLQRTQAGRIGRWVHPQDIHLTLKFLGDISASQVDEIAQSLQEVCAECDSFEIVLAGLGSFPSGQNPRVVWVGVRDEDSRLLPLQQAIEGAMEALGHPTEDRPFHPHLTLARVRRGANRTEVAMLARTLEETPVGELARVPVRAVHLIRSDLHPSGPEYTDLVSAELKDERQK